MSEQPKASHLHRTLSAPKLWALMVGMVISGQYFGWSYGIAAVSHLSSFFAAVFFVIVFYVGLTLSCAELSGFIPSSGGPSAYAQRAFGSCAAMLAGFACLLEFFCAVPAIALSLGSYVHMIIPYVSPKLVAVLAILLVLLINAAKVERMALIELVATVFALVGLLVYYGFGIHAIAHLSTIHFSWVLDFKQAAAAVPFAIWLFLAIEGGVMTAEEMKNPRQTLLRGFVAALLTLVLCTVLTVAITAVLAGRMAATTDAPLLQTLQQLHLPGASSAACVVAVLGLFGLFASLNGITLAYSRQVYALSRAGYLPKALSRLSRNEVPWLALVLPGLLVLVIALSSKIAQMLVALSVLGAMVVYLFVFASLFKLRIVAKQAVRGFKVNLALALVAAALACVFVVLIVRFVVFSA